MLYKRSTSVINDDGTVDIPSNAICIEREDKWAIQLVDCGKSKNGNQQVKQKAVWLYSYLEPVKQ